MNTKEQKFIAVADAYKGVIARVCRVYTSASASFDDLYQEVLINLWQGLESFRGDAQLSTWIYRTAINTCITWHRRNNKHRHSLTIDDLNSEPADTPSTLDADMAELYALIARLDDVEKALITLWLDEKSYDEIAAIMGITPGNVAVKIHRVKQKLSKMATK